MEYSHQRCLKIYLIEEISSSTGCVDGYVDMELNKWVEKLKIKE